MKKASAWAVKAGTVDMSDIRVIDENGKPRPLKEWLDAKEAVDLAEEKAIDDRKTLYRPPIKVRHYDRFPKKASKVYIYPQEKVMEAQLHNWRIQRKNAIHNCELFSEAVTLALFYTMDPVAQYDVEDFLRENWGRCPFPVGGSFRSCLSQQRKRFAVLLNRSPHGRGSTTQPKREEYLSWPLEKLWEEVKRLNMPAKAVEIVKQAAEVRLAQDVEAGDMVDKEGRKQDVEGVLKDSPPIQIKPQIGQLTLGIGTIHIKDGDQLEGLEACLWYLLKMNAKIKIVLEEG